MRYRNIRINPLLRFIYFVLRYLSWAAMTVFYRRRVVIDRHYMHFDGPAIFVVNHPNTLLDVLNPGVYVQQEMFFLANYGLFKHPVSNWLLRRLFCIPVIRREDVPEGATRNNNDAFEKSFEHMENGGVLFIAPEGVSWLDRYVRPLKTGAARIAFNAEARNNWQLGVKIIPVGLTYTDSQVFRSDVIVQAGPPVYARDWAQAWLKDGELATDEFTEHLRQRISELCVDCRSEEGDVRMLRIEEIANNTVPLNTLETYHRARRLIEQHLNDEGLHAKTARYRAFVDELDLDDYAVACREVPLHRSQHGFDWLRLALGAPFFAAGYLLWFLPCYLPWLLNKKMNIYVGYTSTVKLLAGIFTFPLAWWGYFRLAAWLGSSIWWGWALLVLFFPLGKIAEWYQGVWKRFQGYRRATAVAAKKPQEYQRIAAWRAELVPYLV